MTEPDAGRNELEAMRHVYAAALIAATNEMHDNDSKLDADIRLMHHLWLRGFRLRALDREQGAESKREPWSVDKHIPESKYYWKTRALASEEAAVKVTDHQHLLLPKTELRRLRKERDGYKGYWCGFATWAQEYLDAGRWAGHSLSDAIRIELSERDDQLTDLKQRVRESARRIATALKDGEYDVIDYEADALLAELEE